MSRESRLFQYGLSKIFEYMKNYVTSNGEIFLQETHFSAKDEKYGVKNSKARSDEFENQLLWCCCRFCGYKGVRHFKHKT